MPSQTESKTNPWEYLHSPLLPQQARLAVRFQEQMREQAPYLIPVLEPYLEQVRKQALAIQAQMRILRPEEISCPPVLFTNSSAKPLDFLPLSGTPLPGVKRRGTLGSVLLLVDWSEEKQRHVLIVFFLKPLSENYFAEIKRLRSSCAVESATTEKHWVRAVKPY